MADLVALTTFPGQVDESTSVTHFCRVEVVSVDSDEEDDDIHVEDISSPSIWAQYQTPSPEDSGDEDQDVCVALTFYTEGGEVTRYMKDSQSEDAYQDMAEVLAVLGQKGWQAISVELDEDAEETWFLQRITRH